MKGKQEIYGSIPVRAFQITTHNELIALGTISSFQGTNETAFPGLDKLAQRSGLSPQAFSKAATGLFRKGLIDRKRRYGTSNVYFVIWEFETKEEIKSENNSERKKQRAEKLAKNRQSSEPFGYLNRSDDDYPSHSDVSYPNDSDNIVKEHNKRTVVKEQREELTHSFLNLRSQLKERIESLGQRYISNDSKENTAINNWMLAGCQPVDVLDTFNKLVKIKEAIRRGQIKDMFLLGACYTISDLYSYRAKIENISQLLAPVANNDEPRYTEEKNKKYGFR